MKPIPLRRLFSLAFAVLLVSTAGAAEMEQTLLSGDQAIYEAETVEYREVDGVPCAIKTFVLSPDVNPEILREEPFVKDGYQYVYERTDKSEEWAEDTKSAEETLGLDTTTDRLEDVITAFPASREYDQDGYTGTLSIDMKSVQIKTTAYNTVSDSHPYEVTKVYSAPYNDPTLIPESIESDGQTLPRISLTWTAGQVVQGSEVPSEWTATAVYSAVTVTTRQVPCKYRVTATYRGQVSKKEVVSVKYVLRYTGTEIPVVPELPSEIMNPPEPEPETDMTLMILSIVLIVLALAVVIGVIRWRKWHIVKAYALDDRRGVRFTSTQHFVHTNNPRIMLSSFQGEGGTQYTIILSKQLARKLMGKDILIESRSGNQSHTVCPVVGSEYSFQITIPNLCDF